MRATLRTTFLPFVVAGVVLPIVISAFSSSSSWMLHCNRNIPNVAVLNQVDINYRRRRFVIFSTLPRDDEEDEEVEPGKMRVAEIKAELSMRKVDFSDCFDKESLVNKLQEARMSGKADPSIIDEFNKKKLDATMKGETFLTPDAVTDDAVESALGGDGTLPGGMPPEMLKQLVSDPELMALLQNPKMQDVMKIIMSDGQEALQKKMADDREIREMVMKLNFVMGNAMKEK